MIAHIREKYNFCDLSNNVFNAFRFFRGYNFDDSKAYLKVDGFFSFLMKKQSILTTQFDSYFSFERRLIKNGFYKLDRDGDPVFID